MHPRISLMNSGAAESALMTLPDRQRPDVDESSRFEPYKRLHRRLHGRYRVLIPLVVFALAAGGYYGWHKTVPVYRSEGLIHVANSLPKVLNATDQNDSLQMYEEFVDSQVLLMSSRQVVVTAMANPQFQAALGKRPMSVEDFVASLTTEHPPRTQAIDVTFTDPDPDVAAQAVKSVIGAFVDSYGKNDDTEEGRRLDVLYRRKDYLQQQIAALKKQIAALQANKNIPPDDKKAELAELNGELQSIVPVKFKANIDLVLKYYDQLAVDQGDQKP